MKTESITTAAVNRERLSKAGVTVVNEERLVLMCTSCQSQWSPLLGRQSLPDRYWQCPVGCNASRAPLPMPTS